MTSLAYVASEHQHVACFGAAPGEVGWRGEGGVLALEIGWRDPTGLRATPSDEDRDALLLNLRHQLPQRWESQRRQGLDVLVLNQYGRVAGQIDLGLDAGLGGAIDREVERYARLGRIVGSVRADVHPLGHGDFSSRRESTGRQPTSAFSIWSRDDTVSHPQRPTCAG